MKQPTTLMVNGETFELNAETHPTLLEAARVQRERNGTGTAAGLMSENA